MFHRKLTRLLGLALLEGVSLTLDSGLKNNILSYNISNIDELNRITESNYKRNLEGFILDSFKQTGLLKNGFEENIDSFVSEFSEDITEGLIEFKNEIYVGEEETKSKKLIDRLNPYKEKGEQKNKEKDVNLRLKKRANELFNEEYSEIKGLVFSSYKIEDKSIEASSELLYEIDQYFLHKTNKKKLRTKFEEEFPDLNPKSFLYKASELRYFKSMIGRLIDTLYCTTEEGPLYVFLKVKEDIRLSSLLDVAYINKEEEPKMKIITRLNNLLTRESDQFFTKYGLNQIPRNVRLNQTIKKGQIIPFEYKEIKQFEIPSKTEAYQIIKLTTNNED